MTGLSRYPYLALALGCLAALALMLVVCRPHQRTLAVLSGLLTAPFGFTSVLVVPAYWQPRRVFEFLETGIEDLLFSFAVGAVVWLCASWRWSDRLSVRTSAVGVLPTYVAVSALGLAIALAGVGMGLDPMTSVIASFGIGLIACLRGRPGWWRLAAAGCGGFTVLYVVLVKATLTAMPAFLAQWTPSGRWGLTVLGVPAGEIAWASSFGAFWPVFLARTFGVRLRQRAADVVGPQMNLPGVLHVEPIDTLTQARGDMPPVDALRSE